MTPSEALADVRGYAVAGRIRLTRHAERRMEDRSLMFRDLPQGSEARYRRSGGRCVGRTASGDDGVIVVTTF